MTRRLGLAAMAIGLLLASGLRADQGVVKTNDGSSYRGDVTRKDPNVIVTIRGVETVIPMADVASIEPIGSYEQDYESRLSKLEQKDTAGRVTLAREAFSQGRYDLTRDTLELALTLDPGNRPAMEMLDLVQSQIRMERTKTNPTTAASPRTIPAPQLSTDRRLLTIADIEAIRREELQLSDTDVRIRFVGDVKKRYADTQNMSLTDFTALPPVEQAIDILRGGDASMRDKVHVLSDPNSIIEYRRQVQPLMIQTCATIGCHGGSAGGSLLLLTAVESDAVTYTNFYILVTYARKVGGGDGVFGGSERHLVERGRGEQSILANYGLPGNIADFEHPPVNGRPITALFRNKSDARYRALVDWMDESLARNTPNYGIRFTLPSPSAPRPATQPAKGSP